VTLEFVQFVNDNVLKFCKMQTAIRYSIKILLNDMVFLHSFSKRQNGKNIVTCAFPSVTHDTF